MDKRFKQGRLKEDHRILQRPLLNRLNRGTRPIYLKEPLSEEERKNANDWFRCIGGAWVEKDFLALMEKVGFKNIEVISKCRNARTGHPLAICANIRAYK